MKIVAKGKGVMSKDGKTPYAAGTLFTSTRRDGHLWKGQVDYSMKNLANCFLDMMDGRCESIELIDDNNDRFVYKRTVAED